MAEFTHLHVHTHYSLLDGVNKIDELLKKVKEDKMDSVAMTDHGVLYGAAEFWTMSKDFEVKPILGCELYLAPEKRDLRQDIDGIKYYHLLALAKNKTGYHNLIKLVSLGHLEGMYYRPRVDKEVLKKYSEGLIITSACLAGPIARHIVRDEYEKAEEWLKFLQGTFKEDFYLELQRNGFAGEDKFDDKYLKMYDRESIEMIQQQIKVNNKLKEYSEKYGLKLIATTDAHFLNKGDREVQTVLFCIKDGLQIDNQKARQGYLDTYVKTHQEMIEHFSDDKTPLENTMEIEDKIEEYDITFDRVQPKFWNLPGTKTAEELLKEETFSGAKRKYGKITKELEERLNYELKVIHDKGYDDYFLVVADILKWGAEKGILSGVRGSVAGSVAAYCLDIVAIDPVEWELYFERFLNPERPSPPDIDVDIQDSRRDEIIEYVEEKYGKESMAAICAIGRMKTKVAIRDVARVLGIDLQVADKLSKMVQVVFGKVFPIDKMLEVDEEFAQIINENADLKKLASIVRRIEGMSRHMSVHACGYLITPGNVMDYSPLQKETGGERIITQLEGPWIEEVGLMKFDFLGLRTLTIVANAISAVKKSRGVDINFWDIDPNDKKTFELFARGETMGIFQFESPPMRQHLQELNPETLEDLCFMVAAYRPGPMKYIPDYIKRKHNQQETMYLIPEMEPILKNTYGFAIYQEQVIRIAVDIAGYTMGQADLLRRAMGKKKVKIMKEEEPKFKKGVEERGYNKNIADQIWEYLLPFADYGFNKAHAAGYAVLAYKCAYLKAHYPLEFMTALMHSDLDSTDRIVIDINEAKRLGFKVLPPNLNKSGVHFQPEGDDSIRFGLGAIKNVGNKLCKMIVNDLKKNGSFESLDDLIVRIGPTNINKRAVESLIKGGALDEFGDRNALLAVIPTVFDNAQKEHIKKEMGQTDLFGVGLQEDGINAEKTPLPDVEKTSDAQKIAWEKEMLGLFITTHPLQKYNWIKLYGSYTNLSSLEDIPDKKTVKILGVIENIKVVTTRNDGKKMVILDLEDVTGKASAVLFPRTYEKYQDNELLKEATPLIFEGTVNSREGKKSIIINELDHANTLKVPSKVSIDIRGVKDKSKLMDLKDAFSFSGDTKVVIKYGGNGNSKETTKKVDINNEKVVDILQNWVK